MVKLILFQGESALSEWYNCVRLEVGIRFRITKGNSGSSMSVLVPCQKPLIIRACVEWQYFHLLDWFAWVEILV